MRGMYIGLQIERDRLRAALQAVYPMIDTYAPHSAEVCKQVRAALGITK